MLKLGASPTHTREMDLDDIFHSRLLLLIHMVNQSLDSMPLSGLRRRVILTNAHHILIESIALGGLETSLPAARCGSLGEIPECDSFFCRTRDLAMQAIAMFRECSIDSSFRDAISENIDYIHQQLSGRQL